MTVAARRHPDHPGPVLGAVVAAALVWALACTIEPESPSPGPPRVVATSPEQGEGSVARNARVSFWFDGPLDPASIGAGAIALSSHEVRQGGLIHYDPVEWRLTFEPRGTFRPDLAYDAVIESDRLRGLRYGAPVEPTTLTFVTGYDEAIYDPEPEASFTHEVLPLLQGSCALGGCHSGPSAAASLELSSAGSIASTAIGRRTTRGWPGWPLIQPGSAGFSYVIYKTSGEPSVVGQPMPPGVGLAPEEVDVLRRWIDQGAKVDGELGDP